MDKKKNLFKCAIQALNTMEKTSDERVALETNKIFSVAYTLLIAFLMFWGITSDILDNFISINLGRSFLIFIAIGMISYGCLIAVCKKGIADDNSHLFNFFIWSVITLPVTLYNMTIAIFEKFLPENFFNKNFGIFAAGTFAITVIISVILYIIANSIYNKNN